MYYQPLFQHGSLCGEATVNRRGPSPAGRLTGEAPRVGARPDRWAVDGRNHWDAGKRGISRRMGDVLTVKAGRETCLYLRGSPQSTAAALSRAFKCGIQYSLA